MRGLDRISSPRRLSLFIGINHSHQTLVDMPCGQWFKSFGSSQLSCWEASEFSIVPKVLETLVDEGLPIERVGTECPKSH